MKIRLLKKSARGVEIIKQAICFDKLVKFLPGKKGYIIFEAGVDNGEIFLKIKNILDNEIIYLGISPFINNKQFLNINNRLFVYSRLTKYLINKKISQLILKLLHANFKDNDCLLKAVLGLIEGESRIDFQNKIKKVHQDKERFLKFIDHLSIAKIQELWPFVNFFKYIGFNLLDGDNGGRLYLVLKDDNGKHYFLKIIINNNLPDQSKYQKILILNKFLNNKIKTPNIIDFKENINIADNNSTWILYEYINKDNRINQDNIKNVARELAALHQVNIDSQRKILPPIFFNNSLGELLRTMPINIASLKILNKKNEKVVTQAAEYFKKKKAQMGLCHYDFEHRNIFISNQYVYFIDFDSSRYDEVIFDCALLVNDFIKKKKFDLIEIFLNEYFLHNSSVKYERDLIYFASVLMGYDKNVRNKDLNKVLRQIIKYYSQPCL